MSCAWWFLENFQKGISRVIVQLVSLIDQEDACFSFKRTKVRLTFDLSHLFNSQYTFWRNYRADTTLPASFKLFCRTTIQCACHFQSKQFFPDAFLPNKKKGAR